jgi:hypothetical protein
MVYLKLLRVFNDSRRSEFSSRLSRTFHDEVFSCNVVVTKPTHRESEPIYIRRYDGYEKQDVISGSQNDRVILIGEKRKLSIRQRPGDT